MRTALVAVVLLWVRLAVASPDDPKVRAKALFESGTAHYNLSEYKEALDDFKGAYRLFREPTFLFNIAQCERQMSDFAAAANHYRAYRREAPVATNRVDVDALIGEMDRQAVLHPRVDAQPTAPIVERSPPPVVVTQPTAPLLIAAAPPPKKPVTKKAWFWVTVGGAAVIVGAGVALAVVFSHPQAPTASVGRINGN
jgi:tetratricopeptide (TPR) repeat protein